MGISNFAVSCSAFKFCSSHCEASATYELAPSKSTGHIGMPCCKLTNAGRIASVIQIQSQCSRYSQYGRHSPWTNMSGIQVLLFQLVRTGCTSFGLSFQLQLIRVQTHVCIDGQQ